MYQIKEILRLGLPKALSQEAIGKHCGVAKSTVWDFVQRAKAVGLTAEAVEELSEEEIYQRLGKSTPGPRPPTKREPDYATIHKDLVDKSGLNKGMTLRWQWERYYEADPETALKYTQFCEHYKRYVKRTDVRMRIEHRPGERVFIDYCGPTVPIYNWRTGETEQHAQIFAAVLAVSGYTYAEATYSQKLHDWLGSHIRLFRFLGGVPLILVPDNLKSAVKRPHPTRPSLNRSYMELGGHYGCVIEPARSRKARDKAHAEQGVQGIERWILTYLSKEKFFEIESLNARIRELVTEYNLRQFSDREGTRQSWFEQYEKATLQPLPATEYEVAEWRQLMISTDYHVRVDNKYYSAPYQLARRKADVKITFDKVEIYVSGRRVALHRRLHAPVKRSSTNPEHLHPDHAAWGGWTTERLVDWARSIGPETEAYIAAYIANKRMPVQGFGGARGVLSLAREYGHDRLNAACGFAHRHRRFTAKDVEWILQRELDIPIEHETEQLNLPQDHVNVRGGDYYQ